MTLKVKVNDLHFQYQLRVSHDACLEQIWWFQIKSVTSYRADKVTDRQTNGQRQATTIPLRPERLRGNKANLRDLIAATGLVILLKFDPNHRFFSPCDLEIWWMTLENNRTSLLYYIKLCASFQIHQWFQTGVTVRKRSIRVKIGNFLSHVTLKFDGLPWKTIGHLSYVASSFVHHFIAISEFKLELQSGNAQFGLQTIFFFLSRVTLKFNRWPLKNNRAPLVC